MTPSAAAICECVRQGLGLSVLNPLTALSFRGNGLQLRRLSVSVPYRVYLVQPQLRSRHGHLSLLRDALRQEAAAALKSLGRA